MNEKQPFNLDLFEYYNELFFFRLKDNVLQFDSKVVKAYFRMAGHACVIA